jgi:hypothetical protein
MGVKTTMAGLTISAGGLEYGRSMGADVAGLIEVSMRDCEALILRLSYLVNNVLTPADTSDSNADSGNITTINTLITDLS